MAMSNKSLIGTEHWQEPPRRHQLYFVGLMLATLVILTLL
jgi:hypothetical protein